MPRDPGMFGNSPAASPAAPPSAPERSSAPLTTAELAVFLERLPTLWRPPSRRYDSTAPRPPGWDPWHQPEPARPPDSGRDSPLEQHFERLLAAWGDETP